MRRIGESRRDAMFIEESSLLSPGAHLWAKEDLVKAFEVALDKAREFKYELERMKVTFSVLDDACIAYFEVVPEPGHAVLGGDLTVRIDLNTKQVIDFERGQ